MAENLRWPDLTKDQLLLSDQDEVTILIHDGVAVPPNYVVQALQAMFELSYELAAHIAMVARAKGCARVVTRPRDEAQRLMSAARVAAMLDGYSLVFSLEKETRKSITLSRGTALRFALVSILLLLAMSIAVADGSGDMTGHDVAPRPSSRPAYAPGTSTLEPSTRVAGAASSSCKPPPAPLTPPC